MPTITVDKTKGKNVKDKLPITQLRILRALEKNGPLTVTQLKKVTDLAGGLIVAEIGAVDPDRRKAADERRGHLTILSRGFAKVLIPDEEDSTNGRGHRIQILAAGSKALQKGLERFGGKLPPKRNRVSA